MAARRALVVLIVLTVAVALGALLWQVLAPGGWTPAKIAMLAAFAGTAPWTGLCLANGLIGFVILIRTRHQARPALRFGELRHDATVPRLAIAVTVRDEDMRRVLPPLRRLLTELDQSASGDAFALFILSDTLNPQAAAIEESAIAAFRDEDRDQSRIHYRRRSANTGFKAGNIMDFLDHHAEGFELMLTLDADSEMSANAVLRLVHEMQSDPTLAIVQHLTVGQPAHSVFPRLFQFGMRAGMRTWATGQAWWQGDEGPYWGHNAIVRIAPFRAHGRLPLLPDGQHILSHDQIEAAVLSGAGWGVRVLPIEDGSCEANPPAMPEFLRRELRWLAGNLQYRHLLRLPGLRPMGRWQLLQAILMFAGKPLYLLFLLAAAAAAATDPLSPFPAAAALGLTAAWLGALYAPKLLGYAEVALSPEKLSRYGGLARFAGSAAIEFGFTLLLDAVSAFAQTGAICRLALGARAGWSPQNRTERGVDWGEAARLLWPQTVFGIVIFAGFSAGGWTAMLWALPLGGGLLVAIPLCVLTSNPRLGHWLRDWQIAAVPEEIGLHPIHAGVRSSSVVALALQPQAESD
jgi:membrane glycosyltransferase